MKFTAYLITFLLFFSQYVITKDIIHPCLDAKKIAPILSKFSKNDLHWFISGAIKVGLFGKKLKKRLCFSEKFSRLSTLEQEKKIEKWLSKEPRKRKLAERCSKISQFYSNKKLDNTNLETLATLRNERKDVSLKDEFLCHACDEIILPNDSELSESDKIFIRDLEKKLYFYELRKKEDSEHEIRKEELDELEKKALEEFETLNDFKSYEVWNNRKTTSHKSSLNQN